MGVFAAFLYLVLTWLSLDILLVFLKRSPLNSKRQPPGPFPLPVIGNALSFLDGALPHKALTALGKKYGAVASFRVGRQVTVVVSSPAAAKEVLQTRDVLFSNRYVPDALTALEHHESSVALRSSDARWRTLRKIFATQVFSGSRIEAGRGLRKKKVQELLSHVQMCVRAGKAVNIGQASFTTSLNFLSNTIFSIDLGDSNSDVAREFKEISMGIVVMAGTPNVADFFPALKRVDPQGIKRRVKDLLTRLFMLFDKMIDQRLECRKHGGDRTTNDVLDALLDHVQKSNELKLSDVRHLLLDLFIGGTDTTSSTIEWAMAELLRCPEKLSRAQAELAEVLGPGNSMEEEDAARLPYLQAIVKETFRLHPPVPFLVFRKTHDDVPLDDFMIPKDAQVLVNVWAMGRDPSLWLDPETFKPERFLGSSVEFKGQDFELIPFGSGRRICPGLMLASRVLHLVLGSMINDFNWELGNGLKPEDLDMEEAFGINLHRAVPLNAVPKSI